MIYVMVRTYETYTNIIKWTWNISSAHVYKDYHTTCSGHDNCELVHVIVHDQIFK